MNLQEHRVQQSSFFQSGHTADLNFRKDQLKKLKHLIEKNEKSLAEALKQDLGKSHFEAYTTEIRMVLDEIDVARAHLKKWARPHKASSPIFLRPMRSYYRYEPYGRCLIIAPWNYPVNLLLSPAVGAMAAGNVLTLKPSEYAPTVSKKIANLITDNFDPAYFSVVEGDEKVNQQLLESRFDFIFFTGSPQVGKIIMQKAAENLTPHVLELGGKSPCIIDQTANLDVAARRIAWGKFTNAGQTCVAPDYVLIEKSQQNAFITKVIAAVKDFFGADPQKSPDFGRIINQKHFQRLVPLLKDGRCVMGGRWDQSDRYIAPSLMVDVPETSPLLKEEIFGPILPIIGIDDKKEVFEWVEKHPQPLALYVFSQDREFVKKVTSQIQFGGGCVNDTLLHVGIPGLPFGGVGNSGSGRYHGRSTFETFSYQKSLIHKPTWPDPAFRYPPYKGKLALIKKLWR